MSEPIAVAFVEVRPETDDFKANAQRDVQALSDDLTIQGKVELQGLTAARRDASDLRSELAGLGGQQQLQFPGLEAATAEATALSTEVRDLSTITVRPQFEPLLQDVRSLRAEAEALGQQLSGASLTIDTQGLDQAVTSTDELNTAQSSLSNTLGTSATAASALLAKYPQLVAGETQFARATAQEAAQARAAAAEEERLVRVRSRRASSVGPFRVAGIGLLAGTALFSATRALGDLTDALSVSGNEATTWQGKLRNAGASVLSGDVVGAFKALTNETYTYNAAQLTLINQTPQAEEALLALGKGADLARSRLTELQKVSENPIPQFLQTRVAVARASGDPTALREALEASSKAVDDALERAKSLRPNQRALAREISSRREELGQVRAEIAKLGGENQDTSFPISPATRRRLDLLAPLEAREKQLQEELNGFVQRRKADLPAFNVAREALANAKRTQKEAIQAAIADESEAVLAPLAEAVTNARIQGDASRILAALRVQAAGLRQVIEGFKGSADDRKRFKDELVATNQTIETTQKEINSEAERHKQAMIDNRLAPSEEAIIDATVADVSTIPARNARIAAIESILATGLINGKKITRDQRIALKNELAAQNAAIEAEQGQITAENERHKQAMQDKLAEADRSFLASLGGREQELRNQQTIEQARAGLQGDIRVSNELQRFYRESIKVARSAIHDKEQRDQTIASLRADLATETQNERGLRQQARTEAADRRLERADLAIELQQTNENRAGEIRAHQAKIRLLRERIANTRRGSVERQRLRVEIARERADIRNLRKETDKDKEEAGATTLADLFTQQVEINRNRSIGQPLLAPKVGDVTQPIEDRVQRQIKAQADVTVKSPFERTGDKVASSNEKLTVAIDRLTQVIGGGGVVGNPAAGQGPSPAEIAGLRGDAAARFWQSRRGKQLAQETASA